MQGTWHVAGGSCLWGGDKKKNTKRMLLRSRFSVETGPGQEADYALEWEHVAVGVAHLAEREKLRAVYQVYGVLLSGYK